MAFVQDNRDPNSAKEEDLKLKKKTKKARLANNENPTPEWRCRSFWTHTETAAKSTLVTALEQNKHGHQEISIF